jgi:general secretion pathway protein G
MIETNIVGKRNAQPDSANSREARLTPRTPLSTKRYPVRRIHQQDEGFTLIELMIVMAIIGVLAVIAVPSFIGAMKHAREAVLKEDLHVLRAAIDSYTMDKQKGPQSLDDLVQDGYIKSIPEDPMTHSNTTWVTNTSDALYSLDQTDPGIDDVHSGDEELGSDGQSYSTW